MILDSIEIAGFRGLREFNHSFERGKALVVLGLNGTGKSSLFQALTFVITGGFPLVSSVEGVSPILYRHKALDAKTSASVFLRFEHNGNKYWIQREINSAGVISTTYSDKLAVNICEQSRNTFCFLSKKEFISMVDTVERDSWKRISPFLGHENIAKFREGLRTLHNNIKRDLQLSALEETLRQNDIRKSEAVTRFEACLQELSLEEYSFQTLKSELLQLFTPLETDVIGDKPWELLKDIPWVQLELKLPGSDRVNEITKIIQVISRESAAAKISNVKSREFPLALEFTVRLHNDLQLAHDLLHEKFLSVANSRIKTMDSGPCPLCGLEPDDWGRVRKDLARRSAELGSLRAQADTTKKCLESYKIALAVTIDALDEFMGEHQPRKELREYYEKVIAFRDFVELAIGRLESSPPSGLSKEESDGLSAARQLAVDSYLVLKARLESDEAELKKEQDKIAQSSGLKKFYKLRNLAFAFIEFEKTNKAFRISKEKVQVTKNLINQLQFLFKIVDGAESELSSQLLSNLGDEVVRIFGIITDQCQLRPKIAPKTERGIRQAEIFVEDFHGLGSVKARDYLSEANRNSLGLSIYFAGLLRRAPILTTLVLDDITHSSDTIHRRGLSNFLVNELAGRFQLVVLTHDQHWHDRLMSTLPSDMSTSITVVDWSPDGLTYKTDKWSSLLDKAAAKLRNLDHTGGNTLRQALEKFMDEICEQLNILFPYRRSADQISLNEKRQRLEKAIRDSWSTGNGIIDPNNSPVALLLNSQRVTNLASHYGSYDVWDPQDLLDVLKDVADLLTLFVCKNPFAGTICGGMLTSLVKINGHFPQCKRCKNTIVL